MNNNLQSTWKKILPHCVIFVIFLLASAIYFWPALQGKVIYAGDNINGLAAVHESSEFHKTTGDYTYWTGSMFSGMPNYQIGGNGGFVVDHIMKPLKWFFAWGTRNMVFIFLFYLCAFFLLLRSFKVDKWLSMAGAFATALSSYFFVIIAAQHHGKCYSITWMMLVIVGFILTYRKQYAWGALLIMFFTYIGFFLHPQMSYYICMLIGILFFAELAIAAKAKEWKHFIVATLIFFASFAIGMGMGSGNIFVNKEYAEQTMRGGHSDLVKTNDATNKTEGLDLDYATAWSYGINETMTFLIPNYMGGASGYNVGEKSVLYEELVKARVPRGSAKQFCQSAPTYWGEKAFTSGPVYMGAIICFLFVLGLIIVPGPYKWALLIATLFSVALSWGHNFMSLTELFFQYFPMYNKFRAVESILIVAEITMPLLGFLALQQLTSSPIRGSRKGAHPILIAAGITAGICLIMALFGGSNPVSSYDAQWKGQVGNEIYQMILDQRTAMIQADAWRSFIFILLAAAVIWMYMRKNFKVQYLGLILTALIVADMWTVDKRFCNDSNFVSAKERDKAFKMLPYEKDLLASDPSYYRVLNLTANTFNDARTSYYLKSIGGYSAAKLRRYQDLIDEHISKMHMPVLNMLNAKYIISKGQNGQPFPYLNPDALGNAWFVDEMYYVDNANAESDALNTIDLRRVAVMDTTYAPNRISMQDLAGSLPTANRRRTDGEDLDEAIINLISYAPNKLVYEAQTQQERLAVFSEIYYPYGWKCTIDGEPTDIYRVNYMLRAVNIPAGRHDIVMTFEPDSVKKGNTLAVSCFALFVLVLIGTIGGYIYKKKIRKQ
ncbi:MAG: YfhO family protein [Paludibacteraceae bacterium]|nr:YfhO family protein [Paludibacteraceae bacterium]